MSTLISNKKAHLRFEELERFQAGIVLSGAEAKSLRANQGTLEGARVIVRGGEAFIVGLHIPPYQVANTPKEYDPDQTRKLLLKRDEIVEILNAESRKGLTVVPFEVYTQGRYIKVRVSIVRGKNKADKREDLKRAEAKKEADRALRQK